MVTKSLFRIRPKGPKASSQYRGVSKTRSGWLARVIRGGEYLRVGTFETELEAAKAYDEAARKKYGVVAALNFPTPLEVQNRRREWFHQYVRLTDYHEDDCWDWIGPIQPNPKHPKIIYGRVTEKGVLRYAHNVSYEIYRGAIPEGMFCCHTCDRTLCVNPYHIFLGTKTENNADCVKKGRNRAGTGERCHLSKLNYAKVAEIRSRADNGASQAALGREFGVWRGTINSIIKGRTWRKTHEGVPLCQ